MDFSQNLKDKIRNASPVETLQAIAAAYPGQVVFSTSFGWEDQVISHMIFANDIPISVFTLETGRLFTETYYVWNRTLERYHKPILAYYPNQERLEEMVSAKGPNSFYASVENRKQCCGIRKLEPLNRALSGNAVWITGIRASQSLNRTDMQGIEWDDQHKLIKYHPLFEWSLEDVQAYIKEHNIPYNPLHDKGFPSIGCAPCTRAVQAGEDFRAGRWWWEDSTKRECGLHTHNEVVEK